MLGIYAFMGRPFLLCRIAQYGVQNWGALVQGSAPAVGAQSEWVLSIRFAHADAPACLERCHGIQCGRKGAPTLHAVRSWQVGARIQSISVFLSLQTIPAGCRGGRSLKSAAHMSDDS